MTDSTGQSPSIIDLTADGHQSPSSFSSSPSSGPIPPLSVTDSSPQSPPSAFVPLRTKRKRENPFSSPPATPNQPRYSLRSHYFPLTPTPSAAEATGKEEAHHSDTLPPTLSPPLTVEQLSPSDLFLFPFTSPLTSSLHTPDGCHILFISHFLSPLALTFLHTTLSSITTWQTGTLHGHPIPRLSCWFASSPYKYAGRFWPCFPHPPFLFRLQSLLSSHIHQHIDPTYSSLQGCLVNKYRNGGDSMGPHADDEGPLGPQPTIASLNVGVTRTFCMARMVREVGEKKRKTTSYELNEGSLLIMAGNTQQHFIHWVPKQPAREGTRYNLTLRPWKGEIRP